MPTTTTSGKPSYKSKSTKNSTTPSFKIRFSGKFPKGSSLLYLVNKDNLNQTGKKFEAFVDWMISEKGYPKISELTVFLNKPLGSDAESQAWYQSWAADNEQHRSTLGSELCAKKVPFRVINWNEVSQTRDYQGVKQKIDERFNDDEVFRNTIENVARNGKYTKGLSHDQALVYLQERLAAVLSFEKKVIAYVGQKPDEAEEYVSKALACDHTFMGYCVNPFYPSRDSFEISQQALQKSVDALLDALERSNSQREDWSDLFLEAQSVKIPKGANNYRSFEASFKTQLLKNQKLYKDFHFKKFSFLGKDLPEGPLIYAISKDNDQQTGECFKLFTDWAVTQKHAVSVRIILSDDLHRHYLGPEQAKIWGATWVENHGQQLKKLDAEGVTSKILHWADILETEAYQQMKPKVDKLYNEDSTFRGIVDKLAEQHKNKGSSGVDSARAYLLEEVAGIRAFGGGVMTYPAPKLNAAVEYGLTKLKGGLKFLGHKFDPESLYKLLYELCCAFEKVQYTDQQKNAFFTQAISKRAGDLGEQGKQQGACQAPMKEESGPDQKLYSDASPKGLMFFNGATEKETVSSANPDHSVSSPCPSNC